MVPRKMTSVLIVWSLVQGSGMASAVATSSCSSRTRTFRLRPNSSSMVRSSTPTSCPLGLESANNTLPEAMYVLTSSAPAREMVYLSLAISTLFFPPTLMPRSRATYLIGRP